MKTKQDQYHDDYSQGFQKLVQKALYRLKFQNRSIHKTTISPIKIHQNIQRTQLVFSHKKTIHLSREEINSNNLKLPFLCTPKIKLKGNETFGKFRKSQNQSRTLMIKRYQTIPKKQRKSEYLQKKCHSASKKFSSNNLYLQEQSKQKKQKQFLSPWDDKQTITQKFYNH